MSLHHVDTIFKTSIVSMIT